MTKKKKQQNKRAAERNNKVCIVTKQAHLRQEMLRFVISATGEVVFDMNEKLPGAGLWVYPSYENMNLVMTKKGYFNKASGMNVSIPADLDQQVIRALKTQVLQFLGMARKSGALLFGYEGVKKNIDQIAIAFDAQDAAEGGKKKLYRPSDPFECKQWFSREELGRITGQEEQVHTAVIHSPIAQRILLTVEKLDRLTDQQKKG